MAILFSNGAVGTLQTPALVTDTTLHLTTGQGGRFPSPQPGDYCVLTIQSGSTVEIVHVTERVADALTVVRAQEGTEAVSWLAGAVVDLRVTAGLLAAFLQYAAGVALQLSNLDLGPAGVLTGGTLQDTKLRGAEIKLSSLFIGEVKPADGNTARSLRLPNGGARPTLGAPDAAGASEIVTQERIDALGYLRARSASPALYLLDSSGGGGQPGGGVFVGGGYISLVRLATDSITLQGFADGRHPLTVNLQNGDLSTEGWVLYGNGEANSKLLGDLSAKFASVLATADARYAAIDEHLFSLDTQANDLRARVSALEGAGSSPPPGDPGAGG